MSLNSFSVNGKSSLISKNVTTSCVPYLSDDTLAPDTHSYCEPNVQIVSLDAIINHNRSKGLTPNVLLIKEKIMVKEKCHFSPVNEVNN